MLPRTTHQIPKLLREFHESAIGGHFGVLKAYRCFAAELYWVGMKKDVEEIVPRCNVC